MIVYPDLIYIKNMSRVTPSLKQRNEPAHLFGSGQHYKLRVTAEEQPLGNPYSKS